MMGGPASRNFSGMASAAGLNLVRPTATALALPGIGVLVWWFLTDYMRLVDPALVPGPLAVLRAIGDWIFDFDGRLYSGTWLQSVKGSSERVGSGFVFGAAAGVISGVLLG